MSADVKGGAARVTGLVMALFFAFGFCTVLVDTRRTLRWC
jgi:hypothetical protein